MFTADTVTGMFISMMFAGHHTTQGTSAWTLLELLRHPEFMTEVVAELDDIYSGSDSEQAESGPGNGPRVPYSFASMRQIPLLEAGIKETLRF